MRKNLVGDVFYIVLFWWPLLTLFSLPGQTLLMGFDGVIEYMAARSLLFMFTAGIAIGGTLWVIRMNRSAALAMVEPRPTRYGVGVTLGPMPMGRGVPRISKEEAELPEATRRAVEQWLAYHKEHNPLHADLFLALLGVLWEHRNVPASHVLGGHAGLSTYVHSINVFSTILELAQTFEYKGVKNKSGRDYLIELRSANYQFDQLDPVIGIVALAHDIGKLETFEVAKKDNIWVVTKKLTDNHDRVGAQMVARMPQLWALARKDRDAILNTIGHYHAPDTLPMEWMSENNKTLVATDDRTIALLNLLRLADIEAGRREGILTREQADELSETPLTRSEGDDKSFINRYRNLIFGKRRQALPQNISGEAIVMADVEAAFVEEDAEPAVGATATDPAMLMEYEDTLYEKFCETLVAPNKINGSDPRRVGFKFGRWLFIFEPAIRRELEERLGLPSQDKRHPGEVSRITVSLCHALHRRKLLLTKFEGKYYSHRSALFKIQSKRIERRNGVDVETQIGRFPIPCLVVYADPELLAPLAQTKDNTWRIEVVAPLFANRPTNKPSKELEQFAIDLDYSKKPKGMDGVVVENLMEPAQKRQPGGIETLLMKTVPSEQPTKRGKGKGKSKGDFRATDPTSDEARELAELILDGDADPLDAAPAALPTPPAQPTPEGLSEVAGASVEAITGEEKEPIREIPVPTGDVMILPEVLKRLWAEGHIRHEHCIMIEERRSHFFKVDVIRKIMAWSDAQWEYVIRYIIKLHGGMDGWDALITPKGTLLLGGAALDQLKDEAVPVQRIAKAKNIPATATSAADALAGSQAPSVQTSVDQPQPQVNANVLPADSGEQAAKEMQTSGVAPAVEPVPAPVEQPRGSGDAGSLPCPTETLLPPVEPGAEAVEQEQVMPPARIQPPLSRNDLLQVSKRLAELVHSGAIARTDCLFIIEKQNYFVRFEMFYTQMKWSVEQADYAAMAFGKSNGGIGGIEVMTTPKGTKLIGGTALTKLLEVMTEA